MSGGRFKHYKTYLKDETTEEPRSKRHRKHLHESGVTETQDDKSDHEVSASVLEAEVAEDPYKDPDPHSKPQTEPTNVIETDEDTESSSNSESKSDSASLQEGDELQNFFETENVDSHLHEFTDLTVGDFMQDMMHWYKQFSVAGECLGSVLMLFRKYLPSGNLTPSMFRIFDIMSIVKDRTAVPQVKNYCNSCSALLEGTEQNSCQKCSSKQIVYSVSYDVGASLKRFFELGNLAQAIDSYSNKCTKEFADKDTYDVVSGNICRSINAKSKYDVQLIMNFDGVRVLGRPKQAWPIFLTIANVAPEIRNEFLICAKIWQLPDKEPKVQNLLDDWVESIVNLKNEGINWVCPETEIKYNTKVSVVALIADEDSRALLQNISLSSEEFGCNFCEIASEQGDKDKRLYPYKKEQWQVRRSLQLMQQAQQLSDIKRDQRLTLANKKSRDPEILLIDNVKGVKGLSSLRLLPDFNTVDSFSPDYFQGLIYNVVNEHFDLISNPDFQEKEFSICGSLRKVSEKVKKIKLPYFLEKEIQGIDKWEPLEALYWLLHCSLPILKDTFKDKKYLQHLCLLVEAIHTLNREKMSMMDDIFRAHKLLRAFCRDYKSLYGASFESYNIHLLLHFANTVLDLGPLWSTSSFMFIEARRILRKLLLSSRGAKNVGTALEKTLNTLDSTLYLKYALKTHARKESNGIALLGRWKPADFGQGLASMQEELKFYHHACVNGIVYTSEQYSKTDGTCSHFVLYENEGSGKREAAKILNFAKEGDNITCFAKKVRLELAEEFFNPEFNFNVSHIYKKEETNELVCFKIKSILKPLMAVEDYLSEPPNTIELTHYMEGKCRMFL